MAITRKGYGQVEPNHLSAQRTGQIYAQLPVESDITVLENGRFVKYDQANGEVNTSGAGEWMLVYNEEKLYAPGESRKDFALKAADAVNGVMTPRVFKTNVGDIYTTNMIEKASTLPETSLTELKLEDKLQINSSGYLVKTAAADLIAGAMTFEVTKVYTLADGQVAYKVMRIV